MPNPDADFKSVDLENWVFTMANKPKLNSSVVDSLMGDTLVRDSGSFNYKREKRGYTHGTMQAERETKKYPDFRSLPCIAIDRVPHGEGACTLQEIAVVRAAPCHSKYAVLLLCF